MFSSALSVVIFVISLTAILFGLFGIYTTCANPPETWELKAMSGNWYLEFLGGRNGSPDRTESEIFYCRALPVSILIGGLMLIGFSLGVRKLRS